MKKSATLQTIEDRFAEFIVDSHAQLGQDTVIVSKSAIMDLARFLKDDPALQFNYLMDVTAVDYWKRKPRFEVVYHFFSSGKNLRLRVKVPVGQDNCEVDSLSLIWPSANWYEREVFDMFGIQFRGHPDLRRILMYPEFEGHPLRKDYPIAKRQPRVGPKD